MRILFLGCHCDDIELGCGGTIHKHKDTYEIFCHILTNKGFKGDKPVELTDVTIKSLLNLGVDAKKISFDKFEPNHYETQRDNIWKSLFELKKIIKPDLIISQIDDEHQDHVVLYKESIRVFRQNNLSFYLSSFRSSNSFKANTYEKISITNLEKKIQSLQMYKEVLGFRNYFEAENIKATSKANGVYVDEAFVESYKIFTKLSIL